MDQVPEFVQWALMRGAYIHPDIAVERSCLGGYGLLCQNAIQEDTVVLRIPQKFIFDLNTLLELSKTMKESDHSGTATRVINTVLTSGSNFTETAIVRSYIWGMRILQLIRNKKTLNVAGIDNIDRYLDILASTEVLNVDELVDDPDHLIQSQIKEKRKVKAEYNELAKYLPEVETLLPFREAFQLHQAVKSRVLEIPHVITTVSRAESDEDIDEENSGQEEQEDFTTNVTLVPVLDFANHSDNKNAVFDVDRETDDVILRLEKDVAAGDEICISYSPTKVLDIFFRTYGFIPQSAGSYKWKIPHLNEAINEQLGTENVNYEYIAKWLHIYPYLTVLVGNNGLVSLDLTDFRLPLLMIPGLQYNENWDQKVDIYELSHMYQGTIEEIVAEMGKQEAESDVVYGPEIAYGVTWNDKEVIIPNLIEQACESSEDAVNKLIESTIPVIHNAIKRTLEEDKLHAARHNNTVLNTYYAHKKELLKRVTNFNIDDYMQMIEGVYDYEE